ncbi:hypothetical protein ON010_g2348 [Phytophthora cinnamomi]|nr:hypothetical protein ON010_g2348 [Phytophthora cinnamomi]
MLIRAEKDRKRRRLCHERQKLERETLKKQIQELSVLLEERLRKQTTGELKNDGGSLLSKTWEAIAKRQMGARRAAEEQHRLLCAAVKSKAGLIQELNAAVNGQLGNLTLTSDQQGEVATQHRPRSLDAEIYAVYIQELQKLYAQTDDVFKQAGHLKAEAIWRRTGRTGGERYDGVDDPDNTIAVRFRVTSRLKFGRTVSVMQHAVSRRYEEMNRVVIVWRSFTEGEGFFAGMNSDESGWCVLKPSLAGIEIELCVRDTPTHIATATEEPTVEQFTGFVFSTKSDNYSEIAHILETMHLERKTG